MREGLRLQYKQELLELNGVVVVGVEVVHDLLDFIAAEADVEFLEDGRDFLDEKGRTSRLMLPLLSLSKSWKARLNAWRSISRNFSMCGISRN